MSLRSTIVTEWLWCLVALQPLYWSSAASPNPSQQVPKTIEAQAKFFQDFFSVQLSPYNLEFGHVCEDPNNWEQRFEKKDFKNHRDMGKVRWGDKKGGYGEHYWDLNHAGHNNDHDNYDNGSDDDGSYKYDDSKDAYEEPSEQSPSYDTEKSAYDPEKASKSEYDESGRAKRAHQRIKIDKKTAKDRQVDHLEEYRLHKNRKNNPIEPQNFQNIDEHKDGINAEYEEEILDVKRIEANPKRIRPTVKEERVPEIKKITYEDVQAPQYTPKQQLDSYQPYEQTPKIRYQQPGLLPTPSRLILDPTTGQIIDRVTGQAYVLQPIDHSYN